VFERHQVGVLALDLHPVILADRGKAISDITDMLGACGYEMTTTHGKTVWLAPDRRRGGGSRS
jgi:hypothetical protein